MSAGDAPVRFGVIGCGTIAYWTHLRELRRVKGARLVAAADPDPAARARAAQFARIPVHAAAGELLARPDIDAVVICAPTALHSDLAIAAANAGKHVYLEKPIATDADEACRVVEAAAKAGIVAAMGFNRRCHPTFEQARDLIASGRIGPIRAVQSAFCEPSALADVPAWKQKRATGGGVLLDLASHHIDLLRWCLDDEIVSVDARICSGASEQDNAWLRLSLGGGAEASGFFSSRAGRTDTFEFIGECGTLRVDRFRPTLSLRLNRRFGYGVRSAFVPPSAGAVAWGVAKLVRPSWESSYRRALTAFVETCRGGPNGLATLADGTRCLDVILAAERSGGTGAAVRIPENAA